MTLSTAAASFGPALKRLYPNGLKEALYEDVPTIGWLPKTQDFEGEAKAVVIHLSGINGSNTFAEAQRHASDTEVRRFLVTRVSDYTLAKLEAEAMMASRSNKGAVARALQTQTRAALYTMGRSLGTQLLGPGDGTLGSVGSVSTATMTLADSRDVTKFELGQAIGFLDASNSDAALAPSTANTYPVVTAVDRSAGTVTFSISLATAFTAAIAAGDKPYRVGDSASTVGAGFEAWIPATAPTSGDNHFGVDRSVDTVRLAGNRVDGGGAKMEDVVMEASAEAMINGGRPDTLILNPLRFAELNKSAYAKTEFCEIKTDIAKVGYQGVKFATPSGMVVALPEPLCPYDVGWLLQKDTWELASLGPCPHFADDGAGKYDKISNDDGIEFRIRAYWNLICHKPHCNTRIAW